MAGVRGLEPRLPGPKPSVLPIRRHPNTHQTLPIKHPPPHRHCEERSDAAISSGPATPPPSSSNPVARASRPQIPRQSQPHTALNLRVPRALRGERALRVSASLRDAQPRMAAARGIEPRSAGPGPAVLPIRRHRNKWAQKNPAQPIAGDLTHKHAQKRLHPTPDTPPAPTNPPSVVDAVAHQT